MKKQKSYKVLFFLLIFVLLIFLFFLFHRISVNNWGWVSSQTAQDNLLSCINALETSHPLCKEGLPSKTNAIYLDIYNKYKSSLFISRYKETLNFEKLTRSLGDGHTAILPQGGLNKYLDLIKDKAINDVSFTYNDGQINVSIEDKKYPLKKMNGYSVQEIIEHCKTYGEYENIYGLKKNIASLRNLESLVLFDLARTCDKSLSIQYSVNQTLVSKRLLFTQKTSKKSADWDYTISEEENYAILTINQCLNTSEFSRFLDEFLIKLKQSGVENLAIDLRKNGGGNDICDNIISCFGVDQYITSQTLPSKPSGSIEDKIVKVSPQSNIFKGNVYVLTSKNTYSSAKVLAITLSINGLAKIIGEPSSNSPSSYGDCTIKYISGEDYLLQISQSYIYLPVDSNTMDIDIPCDPDNAISVFQQEIGL